MILRRIQQYVTPLLQVKKYRLPRLFINGIFCICITAANTLQQLHISQIKLLVDYSQTSIYSIVPQYNGNLDIKEVSVSTEDWWTNFTA